MAKKSLSDERRISLYLDKDDREKVDRLVSILAAEGKINVNRHNIGSTSDTLRYLVEQELERRKSS